MKHCVRITSKDSVATLLIDLRKGDVMTLENGEALQARENISYRDKVALEAISEGIRSLSITKRLVWRRRISVPETGFTFTIALPSEEVRENDAEALRLSPPRWKLWFSQSCHCNVYS